MGMLDVCGRSNINWSLVQDKMIGLEWNWIPSPSLGKNPHTISFYTPYWDFGLLGGLRWSLG